MNHEDTERLFLAGELDTLRKFRSPEGLALSVYLDLRSMYLKKNILRTLNDLIRHELSRLENNGKTVQEIQEDIDLIELYINTKDNLAATGIIIFSCASRLFWRAFPSSAPIDTHLHIGRQLDIEPLMEMLQAQSDDKATLHRIAV